LTFDFSLLSGIPRMDHSYCDWFKTPFYRVILILIGFPSIQEFKSFKEFKEFLDGQRSWNQREKHDLRHR